MPIKIFGKSSRGHSQGLPKFFRVLTYWAHRAVIFAITQLSCLCSDKPGVFFWIWAFCDGVECRCFLYTKSFLQAKI